MRLEALENDIPTVTLRIVSTYISVMCLKFLSILCLHIFVPICVEILGYNTI